MYPGWLLLIGFTVQDSFVQSDRLRSDKLYWHSAISSPKQNLSIVETMVPFSKAHPKTTIHHGQSWTTLVTRVFRPLFCWMAPWYYTIVVHGRPWYLMVDHGRLWWISLGLKQGPRMLALSSLFTPSNLHANDVSAVTKAHNAIGFSWPNFLVISSGLIWVNAYGHLDHRTDWKSMNFTYYLHILH